MLFKFAHSIAFPETRCLLSWHGHQWAERSSFAWTLQWSTSFVDQQSHHLSVRTSNWSLEKTCNKQLSTHQLIVFSNDSAKPSTPICCSVMQSLSTAIGWTVHQNHQLQHTAQQSHHYQRKNLINNANKHAIINVISKNHQQSKILNHVINMLPIIFTVLSVAQYSHHY